MKKIYCCSKKEETVFVKGNLICCGNDIYLVTDEATMVCVYSSCLRSVGIILNVNGLKDVYKVYHGSVTMEN